MSSSPPSKRSKESEPAEGHGKTHFSPEFWDEDFWEKGGMHHGLSTEPNRFLIKYVDKLEAGKPHIRVFIPMCGMTPSIKWLADRGHTVVGVELSVKPVQRYFDENKLKYSVDKIKDFSVYKSEDKKAIIYQGDVLKFSTDLEEPFDAIWDSHALHAVNMEDQQKYVDVLTSVMTPDGRFLIDHLILDPKDVPADHPHPNILSIEDIQKLLGDKFNVEVLESEDVTPDPSHKEESTEGEEEDKKEQKRGKRKAAKNDKHDDHHHHEGHHEGHHKGHHDHHDHSHHHSSEHHIPFPYTIHIILATRKDE